MFCFKYKKEWNCEQVFAGGWQIYARDAFKLPGFTYSTCGPFTKSKKKKKIEKFMQTGNTDFIYRNELDKACFQHDMAYGKTKDLAKRTQSEKGLRDEAFKIASDPKYNGYQRGLALMVYKLKNLVEVIL